MYQHIIRERFLNIKINDYKFFKVEILFISSVFFMNKIPHILQMLVDIGFQGLYRQKRHYATMNIAKILFTC